MSEALYRFFQLSNAPNVVVWLLVLLALLWSIAKIYDLIQQGRFERRLLRPDSEGRYPTILARDKEEIIIFFDRELGWSRVEFEKQRDKEENDGEV